MSTVSTEKLGNFSEKPKICVYGAGAVGGVIAAKIASAGYDVSVIARSARLQFIQENGIVINTPEGKITAKVKATANPNELGAQDFIIAAPKAYDLPGISANLGNMLGEKTKFVTAMNGLPWWYFKESEGAKNVRREQEARASLEPAKPRPTKKLGNFLEGQTYNFKSLDPDGIIAKNIPVSQSIAMVVYMSSALNEKREIDYMGGRRFVLGEPDNRISPELKKFAEILENSELKPVLSENIREEIWLKLWGNISYNPLSVLTGKGIASIVSDSDTKERAEKIMIEMKQVAESVGINLRVSIEQRMEEARKSGNHKTSMLQDAEKGNRLETDGVIGPVIEISELLNIEIPHIKAIYKELTEKYAY